MEVPDDRVVYSAAALGVVHSLSSGEQSFFEGHTDDISCITLGAGGAGAAGLVATGQVGKRPFICLWDASCTSPSASSEKGRGSGEYSTFSHPYEVSSAVLCCAVLKTGGRRVAC